MIKSRWFLGCLFFLFSSLLTVSASSETTYMIKKGDTLYSIGRRFGVRVSEITAINHIDDSAVIRPGQVLRIPISGDIEEISEKPELLRPLPVEPELKEAGPDLSGNPSLSAEDIHITEEEPVMEKPQGHDFFGFGFGGWLVFLDALAQVSIPGVLGTSIDLVDDLGVDDTARLPVLNVWVRPFTWLKLSGEYMHLNIDGSAVIDEEIVFDGDTFAISEPVSGELDVDRFSTWVEWNPLNSASGYAGFSVGAEYFQLEGALSTDILSAAASVDAGTLTIGGQFGINVSEHWHVRGRGRGMSFEISDVSVDIFDIQGGIVYSINDHIEIYGDYRYLFLNVEEERASGEVTLHGPTIGASLKF